MRVVSSATIFVAVVLFSAGQAGADIVGHWTFDEQSGVTATDRIHGNSGVYVPNPDTLSPGRDPAPSWHAGLIGGAAGLNDEDDGVQEYFVVPSIPQIVGSSKLSVSIWFNQNDGPNTNSGNNGLARARNLRLSSAGPIDRTAGMNAENGHIDARLGGVSTQADGGSFTPEPGWRHALMTWDGASAAGGEGHGALQLYFDGVLVTETTGEGLGGEITASGEWWIGGENCCGTSRGWTGALDDLAIFDEVVSPTLAADLYYFGLLGFDASFVYENEECSQAYCVLIRDGDVNRDLLVNSDDFEVIDLNFGQAKVLRTEGDLINDNFVDLADYLQWKLAPKDPDPLVGGGSAPEPGAAGLLLVVGALAAIRRRG